jgi:sec-independent protein translocase protein TatB
MFDIGLPEFVVLALLALIVFGPDRLPTMAVQAAKLLKSLRAKASAATADLTAGLDLPDVGQMASKLQSVTPLGLVNSVLSDSSASVPTPSAATATQSMQPNHRMNSPVIAIFDPDVT